MPRPIERGQRYVGGLDGIRAVAVLCVIAYHLGARWAPGGMLGVGVFFTLSGYLITGLLLGHWRRNGNLGLRTFWLRRARRLLPALFVMLILVSVWVAVFDAAQLAAVRRQVLAAALYVANWSTIAQHGSYFARFAAPLPLDHLWSLSIEEQFYLVWPWLLLAGIWLLRNRWALALVTVAGAAASALLMAHLFHPGYDPTRVYEGTDTRAFALLVGAALAFAWPIRSERTAARRAVRSLLDTAGVVGLAVILVLVAETSSFSSFLYPTGFVLLSLASAAMIAAVVNPTSRLGAILAWAPLRWIGVRSYGIYLWQWPIIVLWGAPATGVNWPRAALEVAVTFGIAAASWRFVEEPIRQGGLGRLWREARSGARRVSARRRRLAFSGGLLAAVCVGTVSLAGVLPEASSGLGSGPPATGPIVSLSAPAIHIGAAASAGPSRERPSAPVSTKTSCRSVVYIGDSTSEGETSTDYIPNPRQRLQAQLADVGVQSTIPEISGARSIVETFEGHPNAATVAQRHAAAGYRGCWILALGTNDVDNVHDGSTVGFAERIDRMMSIIGRQPAMWIDTITLLGPDNPYAERAMQRWNAALVSACRRYPTMRIFDWAAHARRRWFIPDGIHYYTPGYIARTHLIARGLAAAFPRSGPLRGLAAAFPRSGPPSGCVVS